MNIAAAPRERPSHGVADLLEHFLDVLRAQDRSVGSAQRLEHIADATTYAFCLFALLLLFETAQRKGNVLDHSLHQTYDLIGERTRFGEIEQKHPDAAAILQDRNRCGRAKSLFPCSPPARA